VLKHVISNDLQWPRVI